MRLRLPLLPLLACVLVLQGCAYPKVVKYYDEECQIMAKRMELDVTNVRVAQSCQNDSCLLSLATGLAFSATSIVISGSVVQVGNALYWKERNRKCKRGEPYTPGEAPAPSSAASSAA
jgi:hypothetical protein